MMNIISPRKEPFTITVGGPDADITGFHSGAIQTAVEVIKGRGGGTVRLTEGIFEITGPVRLVDNMTLTGMGEKTVLRKVNGFKTSFVMDADYGELRVNVRDVSGFKPGMGIQIYDAEKNGGWDVSTAVITTIENKIIYFDDYLTQDYRSTPGGIVSNACSIIAGIGIQNTEISQLVIDGNKENNDSINGCRGGGIYLHKAQNCRVTEVKVGNFNGDGISWQITENISIKGCTVTGCTNSGLHPGTGSVGTNVEECDLYDNDADGMFICWRVQHGLFQNNRIHHNGGSGINIGHKDTDNCFQSNHIYQNGFCGLIFRAETESNGPHRNVFKQNMIEDNGLRENGRGILVDTRVEDILLTENIIRDTGKQQQKIGILVKQVSSLKMTGNEIGGHVQGDMINQTDHSTSGE